MHKQPMSDHEREVIERLKLGYEDAWGQFLDAAGERIYRRLVEFSDGDREKAEEYLNEIMVAFVSAIRKIR